MNKTAPIGASLLDHAREEAFSSAAITVRIGALALVLGYAVVAGLSTLVQETWLHGVATWDLRRHQNPLTRSRPPPCQVLKATRG